MVNRFSKISISGYRRLLAIEDLEMRPFTVMIGANGVGKTSVLEVFTLLAASAKGELKNIISNLGGFHSLLTCDKTDSMSFKLAMKVPKYAPLEYSIKLGTQGISYEITHEELSQQHPQQDKPFKYIDSQRSYLRYWSREKQQLMRPDWEYDDSETALSQVPKMMRQPEQLKQQLSSCAIYSAYTLDLRRQSPLRLPQRMEPGTHPGPNGEYLVSCLYNLRETDRARFELIEDTLAVAFRGFKRLNFPAVAAGMLAMTWEDENFSKPLYMDQLSEGTLRFLWLVTLLYSPNLATVTLIDEPEVSLHPELLSILCDAMRDATRSTHLIVATHSDRLIGFLEPKEVLVLDNEEGMTKMTWADSEKFDLDIWLKDYSLAELWQMGRIGGRSWKS
jgi:predicted ATPase